VAIAPSHHRRLRVRNVNIHARMPQPDRSPTVGWLRVAVGVDEVRGPLNRCRSATSHYAQWVAESARRWTMADMETVVAERHLLLSGKGQSDRRPLVIRIFAPRQLDPASVSFQVARGTAVCSVQFDGMSEEPGCDTYGADSLQACYM